MIIGITGKIGAGKGELINILKERKFKILSFGDEVREEAKKRGIENKREALQKMATEIRRIEGKEVFAKKILKKINEKENYGIDGMRHKEDIEPFKGKKDFFLIAIESSLKKRWENVQKRKREGDPLTFEQFSEADKNDSGEGNKGFGQKTNECIAMADYTILNENTLKEFRQKSNSLIDSISTKK